MSGFAPRSGGNHVRVSLGTDRVPAATRSTAPGWRDPRLWIGLLIVAVSVVVGARVLAAADDTVAVWAVSADAGPGAELTAGDLVAHRVRFADEADDASYFAVDDELPPRMLLVRGVGAGELLPRAAVGAADQAGDTVDLPLAVDPDLVPSSVGSGSVVDVYLVSKPGKRQTSATSAPPALSEVTVVDAPNPESGFGASSGRRQLVVSVSSADAASFLAALGATDSPVLTVVRRG